MALMVWSEQLSVNIGAIDRLHRKIVGIINELHGAMKERRGKGVASGLLTVFLRPFLSSLLLKGTFFVCYH